MLVVILHINAALSGTIADVIPNFAALRMPLYFVLSGIFFKVYNPKVFLIKKINNIVVPLLFWLIVSDILHVCYHRFEVDFTIVQFIKDPLYRNTDSNGSLWFLICLFYTNIIFYIIHVLLKNKMKICVAVIIFALIGYLFYKYNIKFPLWIDSAMTALPFFFYGYCCRDVDYLKSDYSKIKSLLLGILLIVISYFIYNTFDHAQISSVCRNTFQGSPVMAYLNSISFVMGIILLCRVINWLPIISFFGRYSIIVLCVHLPFIQVIPKFIRQIFEYDITFWELSIIIFIICWIAIPICKRYLPYFVAQKPLFKYQTKPDSK